MIRVRRNLSVTEPTLATIAQQIEQILQQLDRIHMDTNINAARRIVGADDLRSPPAEKTDKLDDIDRRLATIEGWVQRLEDGCRQMVADPKRRLP
jgi:hypothetical protein